MPEINDVITGFFILPYGKMLIYIAKCYERFFNFLKRVLR